MPRQFDAAVKVAHLVFASVLLLLALSGAVWGMISVHANGRHADSVGRQEWAAVRELMQAEHLRLEQKVDAVLARLGR